MRSFIKGIILLPIAIIVVLLAVANRHAVLISFDPFSSDVPTRANGRPAVMIQRKGLTKVSVCFGLRAVPARFCRTLRARFCRNAMSLPTQASTSSSSGAWP